MNEASSNVLEVASSLNETSSSVFSSMTSILSPMLSMITIISIVLMAITLIRFVTSYDECDRSSALMSLVGTMTMMGVVVVARMLLPQITDTLNESVNNMEVAIESMESSNTVTSSSSSSIENIIVENTPTEEELKQQEEEKRQQQLAIEIEKEKIREQERIKEEKRKEFLENTKEILPTIGIVILVLAIIVGIIYVVVSNWETIFNFFRKTKLYRLINKEDYDDYQLEIKTVELQGYIDKLVELKEEIEKSCKGDLSKASTEYQYSYKELTERIQNLEEQLAWLPTHEKLHRFVEDDIDIIEKSKEGKSNKSLDVLNSYIDLVDKTDRELEALKSKYDNK